MITTIYEAAEMQEQLPQLFNADQVNSPEEDEDTTQVEDSEHDGIADDEELPDEELPDEDDVIE